MDRAFCEGLGHALLIVYVYWCKDIVKAWVIPDSPKVEVTQMTIHKL